MVLSPSAAQDLVSRMLAEWPSFVSDVRENHESHRVETDEYLIPYLAK
jgi:hypothetical protein